MTPNHPLYNILDTFVCQTVWVKMSNSQGVYFWPHVTCAHVGVNHVTCKDDVIMTSRIYQLCSCFIVFYYSEISCLHQLVLNINLENSFQLENFFSTWPPAKLKPF